MKKKQVSKISMHDGPQVINAPAEPVKKLTTIQAEIKDITDANTQGHIINTGLLYFAN